MRWSTGRQYTTAHSAPSGCGLQCFETSSSDRPTARKGLTSLACVNACRTLFEQPAGFAPCIVHYGNSIGIYLLRMFCPVSFWVGCTHLSTTALMHRFHASFFHARTKFDFLALCLLVYGLKCWCCRHRSCKTDCARSPTYAGTRDNAWPCWS